ncbi:hypothetical protein PVK06_019775 [Gossypium arboreum]|uniref:Uncharacterized protein n=1 Tax=Gossypium arboreum TaxID=29729 RepID=A0ABR0PL09_GOSAR|nr:hypothetical protein PVK06_019775 [Gossypium arboreum]
MAREARNIQDYEILNHGSVFFIIKVAIPGTMASHLPPKLTEPLPCPRCDSTNTITTTSLNLATSASHIAVTGLKAELFVTFSSSSSVTHEAGPTPMVVSPTSVMPGPRIKPEMGLVNSFSSSSKSEMAIAPVLLLHLKIQAPPPYLGPERYSS